MSNIKYPGKSLKYLLSRAEINSQYPQLYDAIVTSSNGDSIPFFQIFLQHNAPELQVVKKEKNGVANYKTTYDTEVTVKALDYILNGKINKEFENYKKVEEFLKTAGTTTSKWIKYTLPSIYEKMPTPDLMLKSKLLKQPIQMHRVVLVSHSSWFRTHLQKSSTPPSTSKAAATPSKTPNVVPESFVKLIKERKENYATNAVEVDLDQFNPTSEKQLKAIAHFCYCDDFEAACEKNGITEESEITELYLLGERMGMIGILGEYAKKLAKTINLENVGRIFSLASRGEEQEAHDKAVQYIFTNWGILRRGELDGQMSEEEERHLFEKVSGIADMFCLHKKNGLM